jgi:type IV secretory pathway TrbD component
VRRTIRTLAVAVVVVLLASCAADAGVSAWLEGTWTCQITRAGDPGTDATVTVGTTAWTGGGAPARSP